MIIHIFQMWKWSRVDPTLCPSLPVFHPHWGMDHIFKCLIKSQSVLLALKGSERFTGEHTGYSWSSARDSGGLSGRGWEMWAAPSPIRSSSLLVRAKSKCQRCRFSLFLSPEIECGSGVCVWGKNLVIHIFCLFGSWLNGNLHYLVSAFFPGNQNTFPVQLLSKFHSQIILLFLQVGFPLVEGVWIFSVVDPSQVFCSCRPSLCRKLSFHSWIKSF